MIKGSIIIYPIKRYKRQMQSKADIHVHTKYSGIGRLGPLKFPESIADPKDVVKNAHILGLNVVCITDHNTISGALRAKEYAKDFDDLEIVIGEEISAVEGEVIGLYLNEEIPAGLPVDETIDIIREQGGITVAPHPFSLYCPALKERIYELDLDAIEVLNAGHIDSYTNKEAQIRGACGKWALLGGSDAHSINTLGDAYTLFEGEGSEELRHAILRKETQARGTSWSLGKAINWSLGVVIGADVLLLKSIFGLIKEAEMHDPLASKINVIKTWKKVLALIGSIAYLTPPVPFLCGIIVQKVLKRMAKTQELCGEK